MLHPKTLGKRKESVGDRIKVCFHFLPLISTQLLCWRVKISEQIKVKGLTWFIPDRNTKTFPWVSNQSNNRKFWPVLFGWVVMNLAAVSDSSSPCWDQRVWVCWPWLTEVCSTAYRRSKVIATVIFTAGVSRRQTWDSRQTFVHGMETWCDSENYCWSRYETHNGVLISYKNTHVKATTSALLRRPNLLTPSGLSKAQKKEKNIKKYRLWQYCLIVFSRHFCVLEIIWRQNAATNQSLIVVHYTIDLWFVVYTHCGNKFHLCFFDLSRLIVNVPN